MNNEIIIIDGIKFELTQMNDYTWRLVNHSEYLLSAGFNHRKRAESHKSKLDFHMKLRMRKRYNDFFGGVPDHLLNPINIDVELNKLYRVLEKYETALMHITELIKSKMYFDFRIEHRWNDGFYVVNNDDGTEIPLAQCLASINDKGEV